jgi:hypothetical protein
MKIDGTELECFADDEVFLDFYLGENHETKEQWAKRVWDNCKLYKENNGLDLDGNKLASVYKRDAHELWEEKKRRRRAAFVKECTGEECDEDLLKPENIRKDLEEKKECKWPKSHLTPEILKLKDEPLYAYKTATEKHREQEAKHVERQKGIEEKRALDVANLRRKFDDETISIIYPQGADYLKKPVASSTRKKVGKV